MQNCITTTVLAQLSESMCLGMKNICGNVQCKKLVRKRYRIVVFMTHICINADQVHLVV